MTVVGLMVAFWGWYTIGIIMVLVSGFIVFTQNSKRKEARSLIDESFTRVQKKRKRVLSLIEEDDV